MTSEEDIKKIREMLEFLVKQKISEKIKNFSSDEKKVYNLIGEKAKIVQEKTGFSTGKISMIWQDLETRGILIKEGKNYKKRV